MRAAGVGHGLEPVKHFRAAEAWTGARKTLLFMQGRWRGGEVRAVGRGLGMDWEPVLEPLKHCFSWPGRGWAWTGARKTLLFMAGAVEGGGASASGGGGESVGGVGVGGGG